MFEFASHYRARVAQIRAESGAIPPIVGRTVVLLGDSLTEGHPLKFLAGKPIINQGISGDEIELPDAGLMSRLDLVSRARPAYLFLMIGINDLNNSAKTPATLRPQYEKLLDELARESPLAVIIPQSVLPTRDGFARLNPLVDELNGHIEAAANDRALHFLDLRPVFRDAHGELRKAFTEDGLHLNDNGYAAWTQLLEEIAARLAGTTRY